MPNLVIDVSPELERRLQQEARNHGQEVAVYARGLIEENLAGASPGRMPDGPADVEALAREQGAPLAVRFDDLLGDFWPEDETCDEFIAAVREWRREGVARE